MIALSSTLIQTYIEIYAGILILLIFIKSLEYNFNLNHFYYKILYDFQCILSLLFITIVYYDKYLNSTLTNYIIDDSISDISNTKLILSNYVMSSFYFNLFLLNYIPSIIINGIVGILLVLSMDINITQKVINTIIIISVNRFYLLIDSKLNMLEGTINCKMNLAGCIIKSLQFNFASIRQVSSEMESIKMNSCSRSNNSNSQMGVDSMQSQMSISYNKESGYTDHPRQQSNRAIDSKHQDNRDKQQEKSMNDTLVRLDTTIYKNEASASENKNTFNDMSFQRYIRDWSNSIDNEIEDIDELTDFMTKTRFKENEQNLIIFRVKTQKKIVAVQDLISSFKNTHIKIAENLKIKILFRISEGHPCSIEIHKSIVKYIINNIISNSIVNVKLGTIVINFKKYKPDELFFFFRDYMQKGAELNEARFYLCISVVDNGPGIIMETLSNLFSESKYKIFDFKPLKMNLTFCEILASSIGATLYYTSFEGIFTNFTLCIPMDDNQITSGPELGYEIFKNFAEIPYNFQQNNKRHNHICNALIFVDGMPPDDSHTYQFLLKSDIPHFYFNQGIDCLKFLSEELLNLCPHCPRILVLVGSNLEDMDADTLASNIRMMDLAQRIRLDLYGVAYMSDYATNNEYYDNHLPYHSIQNILNYESWIKNENHDFLNRQEIKMLGLLVEGESGEKMSGESQKPMKQLDNRRNSLKNNSKVIQRYNSKIVFKDNEKRRIAKDYY